MKGVKEVIDALNEALAGEIRAINQYFLHARMMQNRGFSALAEQTENSSKEEMRHAEALIDRILFLEGVPKVEVQGGPNLGQTVTQQLTNDLALENQAVTQLRNAIAVSRDKGDHTSAALLERILASEEEHISRIETHLGLIEKLGENAFLLTQIRGGAPAAPAAPGAPAAVD